MNNDTLSYGLKQQIRTRLDRNTIELETWQSDFMTGTMRKISSQCVDLLDEAVKDGLLTLGWTPPEIHPSERESYFQLEFKRVLEEKSMYLSMYNEIKEELDSFKVKLKEFLFEDEEDE